MTKEEIKTKNTYLELLAAFLNEEYRFPILEIFVSFFAIGTFFLLSGSTYMLIELNIISSESILVLSEELLIFAYIIYQKDLPLFIFVILVIKNLANGLGNDLDKGVMETYFSYPVKRRWLLTAKLVSSLGIPILLYLGIQLLVLYVLLSDTAAQNLGIILITYIAILVTPLLISGLVLLVTMLLKQGNQALITGILIYFAFILLGDLFISEIITNEFMRIFLIINPLIALKYYYRIGIPTAYDEMGFVVDVWVPSFSEVLFWIVGAYTLILAIFISCYYYFERRLEI